MRFRLTVLLENLLRAVALLLSLLHFLGWGFSGETGLLGNSMLMVVCATLATLPAAVARAGLKSPCLTIVGEVVRLRDELAGGRVGRATAVHADARSTV